MTARGTTIAQIEATLPRGLHDAYLEAVEIDWVNARLVLSARVMDSENQDMDRRAKTTVTGLVFCAIDPTEIDRGRRYDPTPDAGLWVDSGEGPADEAKAKLPEVPAGCFLQWFFVKEWNRFIHVCGKHAELTWTEDAPVAARATTRALFPGETIDLP